MVFWLILSGHYDFFHVSLGVVSVLIVIALNWRFRYYFFFKDELFKDPEPRTGLNFLRFIFIYIPWLIWQIIAASLQVAYVVISPRMPLDPCLIKFKTKLKKYTARAILGNSITLTPGTITIDISGDEFIVHALTHVSFSGIQNDSIPLQVAKLYDKKPGQIVSDLLIIKSPEEL